MIFLSKIEEDKKRKRMELEWNGLIEFIGLLYFLVIIE